MGATALSILIIVILGILGLLVIPWIRMKRAMNQVVAIFERSNALDAGSAKTIDELELRPQSVLEGMLRLRDFKPYALQELIEAKVVQESEDGKLYLSQDKLSAWKRRHGNRSWSGEHEHR